MSTEDRRLLVAFVAGTVLIVAWFLLIYLFEPFARPILTPGVLR
jgi:hypothetical protein